MTMLRQISTVILLLSINLLAILAQGPIEGVTSSYTITSGGVPYNYLVYSPPWITRPQGAPLFVFLHGCTQTAEDFMTGVDAKDLADSLQAILLFVSWFVVLNLANFSPNNQLSITKCDAGIGSYHIITLEMANQKLSLI